MPSPLGMNRFRFFSGRPRGHNMRQNVGDLFPDFPQMKFRFQILQALLQGGDFFRFRRDRPRRPAQRPGLKVGQPHL